MRASNSLDEFELYYEDLERKPVKTVQTKPEATKTTPKVENKINKPIKEKLLDKLRPVRVKFDNITKSLKHRSKKAKKTTKLEQKLEREEKIRGIIGIGLLFVVVSITYSTYMTNLFVDGTAMIIALSPQVIFVAVTLLIAFYKIYK